jgi:hypothetical protein
MSITNRFFIYAPFALFVILAGGLTLRWFTEAAAYSKRLDAMNGKEVVPGVTLHFAAKTIAGFPFRLDAVFKTLEIDVATPHGPSSWRAENFALHRLTYGADKTLFEAAGRQTLSWTSLDGRLHTLPFAVGSMQASAVDGDDGIDRFDLVVAAFSSPKLNAQAIQIHARRAPDADAVDLFVSGDGVRYQSTLGDLFDRLAITMRATPGTALASLRAGKMDWPQAFAAVTHANGGLAVQQVEFARDRFDATGKGSLSLDANARPQGTLDFKIAHLQSVLGPNPRGFAKALSDRAAKAGSDDMGRIGIVIGAKDGIVYAGDEPVGMLSPVY